jgi:branched-chain amino acid transport system ATP-binding protein
VTELLIDSLSAGYSKLPIIQDVTVRAQAGQRLCVVGPNGAGKSTLLKAVMGQLRPMSGRVTVAGRDVTGLPMHEIVRAGISYVPQVQNVFPSLTIVENLEMGAYIHAGRIRDRVESVLAAFPDLAAARRKRGGELSAGQRNLLGVARALMLQPSFVLVDEPTAGLAPANTRIIWEQLSRIAADGVGVVVVEQNIDLAFEHADWCYVLAAGRNRVDRHPKDLGREELHAMFLGKDIEHASEEASQQLVSNPSGNRTNVARNRGRNEDA